LGTRNSELGTMILAGDVGGTKTLLALFEQEGARLVKVSEASFPSHEHAGLDEIVRKFVADQGRPIERAAFGVAGPVEHFRVEATNLPWIVDGAVLAGELGLR